MSEPIFDRAGEVLAHAPTAEELGAFADESPARDDLPYYTARWIPHADGTGRFGFNWPACLFGANWCLWRKQYLLAIGVYVAEIAFGFTLAFGYALGRGEVDPADPVPGFLAYLALPFVRIPLGASANRFYLKRATSAILEARSLPTRELRIERIRRRGGTSPLALTAGVLVSLAAITWSRLAAV